VPPIASILVALDLSGHSRGALAVAAELARAFGASLEALHVWAAPFQGNAGAEQAGLLDRMRHNARAELDAFIEGASTTAGLTVARTVISGSPTATISEHAAERRPDLLVLGTHGHGGMKRMVLGSVAESVARYASCATLVVR
jgi:nucleotide-binding universal stress UspA family protein